MGFVSPVHAWSQHGVTEWGWILLHCLDMVQWLPLPLAGPDPTSELQDSSTVPDRIEDNIFQNILSSVPMCSPEMPQNGQKSPVEPQDR